MPPLCKKRKKTIAKWTISSIYSIPIKQKTEPGPCLPHK